METIEATAARRRLGELIEQVMISGEPVLITRHGRPAVVLTPVPKAGEDTQEQTAASLPANSGR